MIDLQTPTYNNDWRRHPYGQWVLQNGDIVFFDRNFCPIAKLDVCNCTIEEVSPLKKPSFIVSQEVYEEHLDDPNYDPALLKRIIVRTEGLKLTRIVNKRIDFVHAIGFGKDWADVYYKSRHFRT